jgi:hypothetical protein
MMKAEPLYAFEVYGGAATLYLRSTLSLRCASEAMHACDKLPPEVRRLRVDMRAVRICDARAVDVISQRLRPWRDTREGSTRVDLPGVPVSFEVLAR